MSPCVGWDGGLSTGVPARGQSLPWPPVAGGLGRCGSSPPAHPCHTCHKPRRNRSRAERSPGSGQELRPVRDPLPWAARHWEGSPGPAPSPWLTCLPTTLSVSVPSAAVGLGLRSGWGPTGGMYSPEHFTPNTAIALHILLTVPVSLASGERSFSKLKLLKNYLRSTSLKIVCQDSH
ncbi:unnamed protein product [Natator depressus]